MTLKTRKILSAIGVIAFFLIISYAFVPQVLSGKIVNQSDISGYQGMAHEMETWNAAHPDDPTAWTDSMFGGMPTTTISAPRQGDWTQKIYDLLLTGRRPATYLFISLLGGFLLMLSLGIDPIVAAGGAIAITFCSYNLQIIQVGHNTKMQAIAFLPWALAAMVFTYRSVLGRKRKEENPASGEEKSGTTNRLGLRGWLRVLLGAVLFGFAISFQVKANHQQITYYLALMILIYVVADFIYLVCDRERRGLLGRWFCASLLLLVMGCAGIATNANKLIPIYKYTPYSMRGGSELADAAATSGSSNIKGLDIDYATAWSYGWEELPNLLIPNFNGGSSAGAVNPAKSETIALLKRAGQPNLKEVSKALPLYWGPQPFTAGPMYMGAITIFLFILGLMLIKGKDKWWIVAATVLAVLLALGSHFLWFTRLFYDHVPFYNKFRTVSMALVVLQITLPMLGFLALDRIVKGGIDAATFRKKGGIAAGISGGFCLLLLLIPTLAGSFTGNVDNGQQEILVDALMADRCHLLRADALRSLLLIAASFALLLWGFSIPKNASKTFEAQPDAGRARRTTAMVLVCTLVLLDLFLVGKRYLNSDDFVSPRQFKSQFDLRQVDQQILDDSDPSYRVLDLSVSPFNDSHPSYWHKNIGGYSPAKLQRYQELIENYLTDEINGIYSATQGVATVAELNEALPEMPVLSALNLKYIIIGGDIAPAVNSGAYGAAWLVGNTVPAATPSEELAGIGTIDLRTAAVIGADFEVPQRLSVSEGDFIQMTSYAPNELRYHYNVAEDCLAVFSEVFYPEGWHAWLADTPASNPAASASSSAKARAASEGIDVPVLRADWLLRAAVLPAGEHDLIMRFDPRTNRISASISRISSIILISLLLLLAAAAIAEFKRNGSKS